VTYGEYALRVWATAEHAGQVDRAALDRGEGVIPRTVNLDVRDVVWRSPVSRHESPTTLIWSTYGWWFDRGNTDAAAAMVGDGESQLAPGHDYLVAVAWDPRHCSAGDPDEPGRWRPLGAQAVLPFDHGVLGEGERMGQVRTLARAEEFRDEVDPASVLARVMGGGAPEVGTLLRGTSPVPQEPFGTGGTCEKTGERHVSGPGGPGVAPVELLPGCDADAFERRSAVVGDQLLSDAGGVLVLVRLAALVERH
jgi:hypothetical protein